MAIRYLLADWLSEELTKNLDPRLGQIGPDLLAVAEPKMRPGLVKFLSRYEARKNEATDMSLVVQALADQIKLANYDSVTVGDLVECTTSLAKDRGMKELTRPQVTSLLSSVGFDSKKSHGNYQIKLKGREDDIHRLEAKYCKERVD